VQLDGLALAHGAEAYGAAVLRARDYEGADDLRRMQRLVSRVWRAAGRPPLSHHVGDLPWRRFSLPGREATYPTRLWEDDGEVVAWAWLSLPDELELLAAPGRLPSLLDEAIAWADDRAGRRVKVDSLDADARLRDLLEARGFGPEEGDELYTHARDLGDLPAPRVPEGYAIRHVRLPDDLAGRVAVHRAAFGSPDRPSRVTEQSYAAVAASEPYREGLDWVVTAPDGSFAAFCLTWLDEENRVGELEPVGTHPQHRRRGLATAVCTAAMQALRESGAETAVVLAQADEARTLYRSLGFAELGCHTWYRRPDAP
jgi:ribosomal protein S18 acetylase RimI-like enzyme